MAEDQPEVQYFALLRTGGTVENAKGLVRRTHTKPLAVDEALHRDLAWHPTEYLHRYYYLGSNDRDHVEVSAEVAEQLMRRWRRRRLERPERADG
jgi:hypothetical protein